MATVQTVTGPVESAALEATLSHEHVFCETPGLAGQYPWLYDHEARMTRVAGELSELREAGVSTIIDVTTPDLGRDVERVAEASRRSGVQVVAATGIWVDVPREFNGQPVDAITEIFVREIEDGIAGSGIRAGVIKVANNRNPGIGEVQEKILRAAARAAVQTGVPVTTHTSPYDIGREQMAIFDDEGLPGHLVAIGHATTGDLDYLREVVSGGRFVSIDGFREGRENEPEVLAAISALCEQGYAGQIMLSHDHVPLGWDWDRRGPHEAPSRYTYVANHVRPALAALGVSEGDLETMLVAAPARFLGGGRG
jgi:phosphotriesterase-related protein